jgi:hypothetical protein
MLTCKFIPIVLTAHFAPKEAVEYTSKVEALAAQERFFKKINKVFENIMRKIESCRKV